MRKFIYITIIDKGEDCDYEIREDSRHSKVAHNGKFRKERGGQFAFIFPYLIHQYGYGKIKDLMSYDWNGTYQLIVEEQ